MTLGIDYLEVAPLTFGLSRANVHLRDDYDTRLHKLRAKYGVLDPAGGPADAMLNPHVQKLKLELKKGINANMTYTREQASELFGTLRHAIAACFSTGDFVLGTQLLHDFSLVVRFSSQPRSREDLDSNCFIEFCTYQYLLALYNQVWFRSESELREEERDSQKTIQGIFKKASFFRTKNDSLISQDPGCREYRMYEIMKVFQLVISFKNMNFHQFYCDFVDVAETLQLIFAELPTIKSRIVTMFSVVLLFVRPFCDLMGQSDTIVDLFTFDNTSFEYEMYCNVLRPLSEGDLQRVVKLFRDKTFGNRFAANLEFAAPQSPKYDFLQYTALMVDLKNMVILLSMTARIPRVKFISLLGYPVEEMNQEEIAEVHSNVVLLLSALGMGRIGVGYNVDEDLYFNDSTFEDDLVQRVLAFSSEVQSESTANVVKAVLMEKYFS